MAHSAPSGASWPAITRATFAAADERRRATRVLLPPAERWRGLASGAGNFVFAVHDFSATGLRIVVCRPTGALAVGAQFHGRIRVPDLDDAVAVRLQVRNASLHPAALGAKRSYGLQLVPANEAAHGQWSQALLRHGACGGALVTPVTLAREGFAVVNPARALLYATAQTAADFAAVRSLRWQCYREAGVLRPQDDHEGKMLDTFDARGRVVVAWHHQRAVASLRMYAPGARDAMALDEWVPAAAPLPPREQAVEFARLAVHADFRGHDMLPTLCQIVARYALAHGRRYLVFGTNRRLAIYYRRFGALDTGVEALYGEAASRVMLVDLVQVWRHGTPLARHAMFGSPPPLRPGADAFSFEAQHS